IADYEFVESIKLAIENYKGLFVCAAGNYKKNNDSYKIYPSDYSYNESFSDRVISVGALHHQGVKWSDSNYGAESVSIFAPGELILSNYSSSTIQYLDGTSMAAPFVTGVAALMFSMYKEAEYDNEILSHAEIAALIKKKIIETATYQSNLDGYCVAKGRLNAYEAVKSVVAYNTTIIRDEFVRIDGLRAPLSETELIIPDRIDGKTVIQIGDAVFANQTALRRITIPSTVLSIGNNAFQGCTSLESVYLDADNNLRDIGNSAFEGCNRFGVISATPHLRTIGSNAFANCHVYFGQYFEESTELTTIGNGAFYNCGMTMVHSLPGSIETIGANAFQKCRFVELSFENLYNPVAIENSAFAECLFKGVTINSNIYSIGYDAFSNCHNLESVIIAGTPQIYANAFANCENLTIYTWLPNPPSYWMGGWNSSNRPVVFGCEIDEEFVVRSFTKSATNPYNINAENGVNNQYRDGYTFCDWYTTPDFSGTSYPDIVSAPNGTLYALWGQKSSCVAEGTLITLADGSQKAVEELTGDEMLLVWNMFTGKFDVAPILFIDKDPTAVYEVINLHFSDGTGVKVISEHAFWDFDLNEYVYLRSDASKYIGHMFNKQSTDGNGNMTYMKVQLVDVVITHETTTAYSPVTYGHLCYYVNGMLSMPGGITGLINIFDVDGETLTYDKEAFDNDIETYGLFTYEEFAELLPVPEYVFEAVNGQYLKVAIGKGLINMETLARLFETYKNLL
ncbi:MAG: leucine-rich repeat protein, partial [Clostridia bacterium]|nr:leucine-rich repeat protein [Clostridia bacterium]